MQVHFIDEHTGEVIDKQIKRAALLEYVINREPCLIGMEACGGSQYWARELESRGIGQATRQIRQGPGDGQQK